MDQVLPYVYRLTHKETGQFYIGFRHANRVCSSDDLGKKYFTSSKQVKPIFDEFESVVLAEFFDRDDAYWFEQELIKENWGNPLILNKVYHDYNSLARKFYNPGGRILTTDEKLHLSMLLKGRPKTPEHIEAVAATKRGKPLTEKHRLALIKPKTLTEKRLAENNSAERKIRIWCTCTRCKRELPVNNLRTHINKCDRLFNIKENHFG